MSDRNPYYTLESFTLTDILEDEEYDLRKWENVSKFVDRLNHVTGNAIRLQNENNKLNIQLKTRVIVNKQYEKIKKLEKENEQLKEANEKLRWDLDKTREDLNYFATLKIQAMKGCEPMENGGDDE